MILNFNTTVYRNYLWIVMIISLILTLISPDLTGQKIREKPPPLKERLFFGGNFGLQFGTYTDIQVSPVIGLWVLPRLAVAAGPDYRFYKFRDEHTNLYGGKIYVQYVVIRDISSVIPIGGNTGIFFHLENELLSLESSYWKTPPLISDRFYINTVLAGGGISQPIGRRSSLNIMVLWELNDSGYEVYNKPEIRFSFSF